MRILPLLVAAAVALPGCTMTAGQKKTGILVGALTAIAGAATVGYARTVPCQEDPDLATGIGCAVGAIELNAVGIVVAAAGLVVLGASAMSATMPEPKRSPESPTPIVTADPTFSPAPRPSPGKDAELVRTLTESARTAARQGSCRSVETIANRVAELDPTYRRGGFASDPDIASCVD
jgi:hypothetical protein